MGKRLDKMPLIKRFEARLNVQRYVSGHKTKTNATKVVERLRKKGYKAMAVPDISKSRYRWSVYKRKPRRYTFGTHNTVI